MSYCCICGTKKAEKPYTYNTGRYHGLGLLRMYDRQGKNSVCSSCNAVVERGELMVLHSQLPLPGIQYSYHRGLFATQRYLSFEKVCEYTGRIMSSKENVKNSKSPYIINCYSGKHAKEMRTWIDGTSRGSLLFWYFFNFFF